LHPTDYELRLGILQAKVESFKPLYPDVTLEPNVTEFLAHRIASNVRVHTGSGPAPSGGDVPVQGTDQPVLA